MKFLIITHVLHKKNNNQYFGYAPYVREMNLWLKHVDKVILVAPFEKEEITNIDLAYRHKNLVFNKIPKIAFISIKETLYSLFKLPLILFAIFKACKKADHIHLRCPGNIGLLGCLVQIIFPSKIKTAKYAGNWNPNSKQPLSYRIQKWILSNRVLTKNMKVLVYGNWQNQSKNIKPFFTATYSKDEIEPITNRDYSFPLNFMFVGSLVDGKRPLLAVKIVQALIEKGIPIRFNIYGEGVLKKELQDFLNRNNLNSSVVLHGNKPKLEIKNALKQSHFLILPSKSEGWPKAIAEAMFFGAIPISTKVSCIPYMLDNGKRGVLIEPHVDLAVTAILSYLKRADALSEISKLAIKWSQKYTLDLFESEIKKLVT
ncbi:glycosyltransferase family 4 protein [Seonamhaeicola sp. MEBiC1930]|uniref:glycosyltransferase family 4 protein n=1 Tax=Seonamhaeicola sp. MEBiC01930 TaxID=2976768 RepID=UPI00324A3106